MVSFGVRLTGPGFVCAIYYLLWRHTEVFLTVISKVLRKRLGIGFGMVWVAIGVVITFNVVFNHVMCMVIKPGGPTDLAVSQSTLQLNKMKKVEKLRNYYKERK